MKNYAHPKLVSWLPVSVIVPTVLLAIPWALFRWEEYCELPEFSFGVARPVGWLVLLMGLALFLYCVGFMAHIGKGNPAPLAGGDTTKLVVSGPYRFARHPMALGGLLALVGEAILYESWFILAQVGLMLVFAVTVGFKIEGRQLRERFGKEYEQYCHRVGPLWPKRRRRNQRVEDKRSYSALTQIVRLFLTPPHPER